VPFPAGFSAQLNPRPIAAPAFFDTNGNQLKTQYANNVVDIVGDSRAAMAWVSVDSDNPNAQGGATAYGLNGFHPINWLNMMTGNRITIGQCFAKSGERSDQYFSRFRDARLKSNAGWTWYNFPAGNDIGYAMTGYTDLDGNVVTTANVAAITFERLRKEWELDIAAGKKVLVNTEPGATNFDAAAVRAVHELNLRIKCYVEANPFITLIDLTPILWAPTQSATQIRFKTGYLQTSDTIHLSATACYAAAKSTDLQGWVTRNFQFREKGVAAAHDVYATNPRQIIRQPFQLTATGGVTGANATVSSGTVPGNYSIKSSAAASVSITQADTAGDATGGKDTTWAITMGASAGIFEITADSPSTSYWSIDSLIETGVSVDVAANTAGANVYGDLQINTTGAGGRTEDFWALYYPRNLSNGPTEAYSLQFKTEIAKPRGGAATGYLAPKVLVSLGANQTVTITTRRWWGYLRF
jgi:hypothetical protein